MNTLFEAKLIARNTDPDTSKKAAEKMVKGGKLDEQEKKVWEEIKFYIYETHNKDFTAKELSKWEWSNLSYFIIQRRLSGLRNKGKIAKTGEVRNGCAVYKMVR